MCCHLCKRSLIMLNIQPFHKSNLKAELSAQTDRPLCSGITGTCVIYIGKYLCISGRIINRELWKCLTCIEFSALLSFFLCNRMSVFDRLAPLIPQVSASCRQTKEHPTVCLSPPLSLSSPVIKKKVIQIPSFDERGLISEKHNTKLSTTDRWIEAEFYIMYDDCTESILPLFFNFSDHWLRFVPSRHPVSRHGLRPVSRGTTEKELRHFQGQNPKHSALSLSL